MDREFTGIDREYQAVKDFQEAFGHPVADKPTYMKGGRAVDRIRWMQEEILEFWEAEDVVGQADAMIDLIYFALGTLVEIGVKPQAIFDIVQNANMAKLHKDGKPRYREDGKIIKPDGWVTPEPQIRDHILGGE